MRCLAELGPTDPAVIRHQRRKAQADFDTDAVVLRALEAMGG